MINSINNFGFNNIGSGLKPITCNNFSDIFKSALNKLNDSQG